MSEFIISLDPGKYEIKAIGKNANETFNEIKRIHFRTKLYDLDNGYVDIEGNSHKVEMDGHTFIVGEQGEEVEETYETSKTSLLHKICAYTAISQFLEPTSKNNKINLVLACPLSVLKVSSAKEEYKKFIKGDGIINIKVDEEEYSFEIVDITIKAEDSGIRYLYPQLFDHKEVAIIGFGGLNMNFSLYRNGTCQPSDRFPVEFGAIKLTNYLAEDLTVARKGNIVSYYDAERALSVGYLIKNEEIDNESIDVIKSSKERFFNDAKKIILRKGYRLENIESTIFVGGTTLKIVEAIKSNLKNSYIPQNPNPQWITAEGLYKVVCAKYNNAK